MSGFVAYLQEEEGIENLNTIRYFYQCSTHFIVMKTKQSRHSGTDVAMASGHVIMMKNDLQHVILALKIGRYAFKKIKENLAISFAYNAITMSIAAGVFYSFTNSLVLTPALAALGWIVSDSLVFGNSLLVRRFHVSNRINSKRNYQQ